MGRREPDHDSQPDQNKLRTGIPGVQPGRRHAGERQRQRDNHLWHVATRTSAATLTSAGYAAKCVAFSPDGSTLASGNQDGTITLWDVAARTRAATLPTGTSAVVHSVAFSPDGTTLAGGGTRLMVWKIRRP